jgi:hypothetical protein
MSLLETRGLIFSLNAETLTLLGFEAFKKGRIAETIVLYSFH